MNPSQQHRYNALYKQHLTNLTLQGKRPATIDAYSHAVRRMTGNTAHYFRNEVQKHTNVYLVDMLKTTVDLIKQNNAESIVGILCTNGTYNSCIYDRYLKDANLAFIKPAECEQEHYVHSAIYGETTGKKTISGQDLRQTNGIKSGEFEHNAALLSKAIQALVDQGVSTVILGCTELPLVRDILQKNFANVTFIDPMEAVADRVVDIYKAVEQRLNTTNNFHQVNNIENIHSVEDTVNYILSQIANDSRVLPMMNDQKIA
ncbi:aspartate/glutamate racemase family protein [Agarivorans sp. TSD2052]|uniref:aspartate/glutamate racemase family protein n=1 Tax=Agarivorans sp. TSD2052 TaxID=2937286 RepID=UPI0020101989|nr:aspartate/glutamate racemase family protein [Agarivorans sp. TSD2052]UPW18991.1 aspartate/glutamate racemase family protein [Agarivorans sp. TSD2052]